jgi:hypothetical protein
MIADQGRTRCEPKTRSPTAEDSAFGLSISGPLASVGAPVTTAVDGFQIAGNSFRVDELLAKCALANPAWENKIHLNAAH